MARKKFTTEQIIRLLREAEIELGKGKTVDLVCKKILAGTGGFRPLTCPP